MDNPWDVFYLYKYRVELRALSQIDLPAYSGSTLKGAFGRALRQVSCSPLCDDPRTCIMNNKCPYYFAFESIRATENPGMRTFPHPYLIEPPNDRIIAPDHSFHFDFLLFGNAIDYLPHFIYAFIQMGKNGIGRGRGAFTVQRILSYPGMETVYDFERNQIYSLGEKQKIKAQKVDTRVQIKMETPIKLKQKGSPDFDPEFYVLVKAILRRASAISRAYCGHELELPFKDLIEEAKRITKGGESPRTVWIDRYSSRQERIVTLAGSVGSFYFDGDFSRFYEILDCMEKIHIGNSTVLGFGKVKIINKGK